MIITPTTPIIIEGETYDKYTVSLALMVRYNKQAQPITSVNISLIPTRVTEEGQIITADAHRRGMVSGDAAYASPDVQKAINAILLAGQEFISGRKL